MYLRYPCTKHALHNGNMDFAYTNDIHMIRITTSCQNAVTFKFQFHKKVHSTCVCNFFHYLFLFGHIYYTIFACFGK